MDRSDLMQNHLMERTATPDDGNGAEAVGAERPHPGGPDSGSTEPIGRDRTIPMQPSPPHDRDDGLSVDDLFDMIL